MNVDWIRARCLSFPHATEQITWGSDLTFRVAGKIFAVAALEPARVWLCFKCSPEAFAELTERPGIIPAPYLARAHWVALENRDALPQQELSGLLNQAYELIFGKLPKRARQTLQNAGSRQKLKRGSRKKSSGGRRPSR